MTLLAYLTQDRVAHAQRLLVITAQPILKLAFNGGVQSASAFYAAFRRATGVTPFRGAKGGGQSANSKVQTRRVCD